MAVFNIFTYQGESKPITFHSRTHVTPNTFIKCYRDIDEADWKRITNASQLLSDAKIGPKVYSINESGHYIEYQRVIPLGIQPRTDIVKDEFIGRVNEKITHMHELGYAHGDLHLDNIGFDDEDVYLLDHDSVFRIADGTTPWIISWMKCMSHLRDWDGTFDGFINLDYKWRHGWLKE